MSTAALRSRLTRAARHLPVAAPNDYTAHWKRVNDERMQALEAFVVRIPDSHAELLIDHLLAIEPHLFVAGAAWMPEDASAMQQRGIPARPLANEHAVCHRESEFRVLRDHS